MASETKAEVLSTPLVSIVYLFAAASRPVPFLKIESCEGAGERHARKAKGCAQRRADSEVPSAVAAACRVAATRRALAPAWVR